MRVVQAGIEDEIEDEITKDEPLKVDPANIPPKPFIKGKEDGMSSTTIFLLIMVGLFVIIITYLNNKDND